MPRNQWHNRGHQWHQRKLRERISVLAAAWRLEISTVSVSQREVRLAAQRAQKKAIAALRQQLAVGGCGPAQRPW